MYADNRTHTHTHAARQCGNKIQLESFVAGSYEPRIGVATWCIRTLARGG
jgi:hypothetical protein